MKKILISIVFVLCHQVVSCKSRRSRPISNQSESDINVNDSENYGEPVQELNHFYLMVKEGEDIEAIYESFVENILENEDIEINETSESLSLTRFFKSKKPVPLSPHKNQVLPLERKQAIFQKNQRRFKLGIPGVFWKRKKIGESEIDIQTLTSDSQAVDNFVVGIADAQVERKTKGLFQTTTVFIRPSSVENFRPREYHEIYWPGEDKLAIGPSHKIVKSEGLGPFTRHRIVENRRPPEEIVEDLVRDVEAAYQVKGVASKEGDVTTVQHINRGGTGFSFFKTKFTEGTDELRGMTIDLAFKGRQKVSGNRVWLYQLWEFSKNNKQLTNADNPIAVPRVIRHEHVTNLETLQVIDQNILARLSDGTKKLDKKPHLSGDIKYHWQVDSSSLNLRELGFIERDGRLVKQFSSDNPFFRKLIPTEDSASLEGLTNNGIATSRLVEKINRINKNKTKLSSLELEIELKDLPNGRVEIIPHINFNTVTDAS